MKEHDLRLAPGAVAAIVTSALASGSGTWGLALAVWAAATVGALVWLAGTVPRRRGQPGRRIRSIALALTLACAVPTAVSAAGMLHSRLEVPQGLAAAIAQGDAMRLSGTVVTEATAMAEDPFTHQPRVAFDLAVDAYCAEPCTRAARAGASVRIVTTGEPPRLGDRVTASGTLSLSRAPSDDAVMWDATTVTTGVNPVWAPVTAIRARAAELTRPLPLEVRGLVLGMVTGDTRDIPASLQSDMKRTGLTHLTAVSGSHFAIVTIVVGIALRRTVRSRRLRAVGLAAAMVTLAAVVLAEPSVLRALTMALAVALGWLWGRPARALSALSAGSIVLLIAKPDLGAQLGFQLSVTAVVAIVLWSPRIAAVLGRWLIPWLAKGLAVPLAAWLACAPLLVGIDDAVGTYTAPANLVAAISAGPVTVLGLLALPVSWLWPWGASVLMDLAGASAWPVVWAARGFSRAPGAWIAWPDGPGGVALALGIAGAALLATAPSGLRDGLRLGAALLAVALAGASPLWAEHKGPVTSQWSFVLCDVGQGSMMMARVGAASAVVVDTGPPGGMGAACLERYGVDTIALLVITHPHADHDGAIEELAETARIDALWVSQSSLPMPQDPASLMNSRAASRALAAGIPVQVPAAGAAWAAGEARVTVLLSPRAGEGSADAELNDTSLALLLTSGGESALVNGDAETQAQDDLRGVLAGGIVVDLVVVPHHGSRTQSAGLAQLITARVAAVSVGASNPYGHPAPATLDLYATRARIVLTTATCGDIALGTDGAVHSRCG